MKKWILTFIIFVSGCFSINSQMAQFENFTLNDSNVIEKNGKSKDEISIIGRKMHIIIRHSAIDSLQYQYKLEGIDKKWIDYEAQVSIYYHEIPGGNNPFMIRQKINGALIRTVYINVLPQLWQKWWFLPSIYFFILLIIGSGFYFVFLYRLRQSVEMRQVRNHIAADLHDEIGATLSGIGILSSLAQRNLTESHPSFGLLVRIHDDALSIGNIMDDIVWSINPKNDDLENIIARMSRYAAELFDAKGIDYQIVIPENLKEVKLSMEQRRDVYLIFKEGVNNLVKYSKSTKALVEIKVNKQFELLISDNGKGFNTMLETNRNGLKNMKNRAIDLNGNLKIESEIGIGTSVKLIFTI